MDAPESLLSQVTQKLVKANWQVELKPWVAGWALDLQAVAPSGKHVIFEVKSAASCAVPDVLKLASARSRARPISIRSRLTRKSKRPETETGLRFGATEPTAVIVVDDESKLSPAVHSSVVANGIQLLTLDRVESLIGGFTSAGPSTDPSKGRPTLR